MIIVKYSILCFILTLAVPSLSIAIEPRAELSSYGLDLWDESNGLFQSPITAIVQTKDGYIWFSTQRGIVRFDGVKFLHLNNQSNITSNAIYSLIVDQTEALWMGTHGRGLMRYKDGHFTTYTTKDGLPSDYILVLENDNQGGIWVGTDKGLSRFKDGSFTTFTIDHGLPGNKIRTLYADEKGTLWIGTPTGLGLIRDGQAMIHDQKDLGSNPTILNICGSSDGTLWIKKHGPIIYKLVDGRVTKFSYKREFLVKQMYAGADNVLWIASDEGLMRLKDKEFSIYKNGTGSIKSPISLFIDMESNLWIGTQSEGLAKLRDLPMLTLTTEDGLYNNIVNTVFEDREGNIWIGTNGGLSKYKDGNFNSYPIKDKERTYNILSITEDKAGVIWIGTNNGLYRMIDNQFVPFDAERLSGSEVCVLYRDRQDKLWVGAQGRGLLVIEGDKVSLYTVGNGLSDTFIRALYQDANEVMWIGSNRGLSSFKDGKFTLYTEKDGLASNYILAINGDEDGALWITTRNGLNRFKDGKFTTYTVDNGLYTSPIYQILPDGNGQFWMTSSQGIFSVKKQKLNEVAEGKIQNFTSIPYGRKDGMQTGDCAQGFQPSAWKSRDGNLWFATYTGVVRVNLKTLKPNNHIPPVYIEGLLIDKKFIKTQDSIEVKPGNGDLEIHYTALSYTAPEKVKFKYRLEGFDKDWIDAGIRRVAYYTNLPPGNYSFRVIATNNDGVWNQQGDVLNLYLKPRIYQTYWFYLICMAALGLIALSIYRFRMAQIQGQFTAVLEERARIAREIHDTLAQGFVGISAQLQGVKSKLSKDPEEANQYLERAISMVKHSLVEARNSVWDMRLQAVESVDLITALDKLCADESINIPTNLQVNGSPFNLSPLGGFGIILEKCYSKL
jgi:ligand-binding sensor domain-containing protein